MTIITSKANNLVKKTKKLHQKKYRQDSYLIEGWHLFEEAVLYGAELKTIFVTESYAERVKDYSNVFIVTSEILSELADSKTPQGIVAEIGLRREGLPACLKGQYLFLEDVQDPGNLGTMIRTADAAGFTGVILSDKSADLYNMKTLRSMQGSHFHLPIYRLATDDFIQKCQDSHLPILASTLSSHSVDYKSLPALEDFALVMGNEGKGISDKMANQADYLVHITMKGKAESLNVAVAAGILIFTLS